VVFGSKEGMRLGDEIAKTKVVKITNTDKDTLSRGT